VKSVTYFLIDRSGCCYLVIIATGCVPDLLHHLDRLLNRHIPRIGGLTNKRHISRDERVSEPLCLNPLGESLIPRLSGSRFAGLRRFLDYELLVDSA
jgi:hypothetical protein